MLRKSLLRPRQFSNFVVSNCKTVATTAITTSSSLGSALRRGTNTLVTDDDSVPAEKQRLQPKQQLQQPHRNLLRFSQYCSSGLIDSSSTVPASSTTATTTSFLMDSKRTSTTTSLSPSPSSDQQEQQEQQVDPRLPSKDQTQMYRDYETGVETFLKTQLDEKKMTRHPRTPRNARLVPSLAFMG